MTCILDPNHTIFQEFCTICPKMKIWVKCHYMVSEAATNGLYMTYTKPSFIIHVKWRAYLTLTTLNLQRRKEDKGIWLVELTNQIIAPSKENKGIWLVELANQMIVFVWWKLANQMKKRVVAFFVLLLSFFFSFGILYFDREYMTFEWL